MIRTHWDDIGRVVAALKGKAVTPSLILKKLSAFRQQNGLAAALREVGRIELTLFTLRWFDDPALRRLVTAELNKGEAKNSLSRAVAFHRLGRFRDRGHENQSNRAAALNFAIAAIILFNCRYLGRAIDTMRARGTPMDEKLIPQLSPLAFAPLAGERFDAAVDLSRHPGQVSRAVAAVKGHVGHWTFVSTTSVYADTVTRGQRADTAPLLAPTASEVECSTEDNYGAAKVACEQAVGDEAFICRAGLIVGPGDPTGRFSYWPARLKKGGEVLVPEKPNDPVQYIDVRDLAQWIVHAAHARIIEKFDAIGPSYTRHEFLDQCMDALGSSCAFTWVDQEFMDRNDIRSGSGPRSLPLPMPDSIGDSIRDVSAALAAGLILRPLSETARDTLLRTAVKGPIAGLTIDEENISLNAWHAAGR